MMITAKAIPLPLGGDQNNEIVELTFLKSVRSKGKAVGVAPVLRLALLGSVHTLYDAAEILWEKVGLAQGLARLQG